MLFYFYNNNRLCIYLIKKYIKISFNNVLNQNFDEDINLIVYKL